MRKFIVGTDWWTDCDDVIAMRLLARAAKKGEIALLGVVQNACMPYSAASLQGFLQYEGIFDLPQGIDLQANDFGRKPPYQEGLALRSKASLKNEEAEDAVKLYRRLLANACEKIELIELGYPQVLAHLLQSSADEISPQSGAELVAEKVEKLWIMAGKWDDNPGKENNFARNRRARHGAHILCNAWPTPITFLGWEVGYDVITGKRLKKSDLLYNVLVDTNCEKGRCSWDPMLALMAIIGSEEKAGYRLIKGRACVEEETGCNTFVRNSAGRHGYVIRKMAPGWYEEMIENAIASL